MTDADAAATLGPRDPDGSRGPSRSGAFRWLCLLPVASLVAAEFYVAGYDGWGAWAAAPLLLLPGLISLPIVLWGVSRLVRSRGPRRPRLATAAWTLVAGLPLFWLLVRRFVM